MNTQSTIDKLVHLRLHGMATCYKALLDKSVQDLPDFHTILAQLVESEEQHRTDHKSERMLRKSKLRYDAVPEDIHCSAERGLTKEQLVTLLEGSYIRKGQTVLIEGLTGTGKSFLACALGRHACQQGHHARFISTIRLFEDIAASRIDESYRKYMDQLEKLPLLILDDFGIKKLDAESSIVLKEILDARYRKAATILTSQIPVSNWYELFKEKVHADAIMDRLTAKAHHIQLLGKSLRR